MNKKNTYIRTTIILLCITTPSFYLLSSYYTPRKPAGKRPQGYTGPRSIRQIRSKIPVAQQQSDQIAQNTPAPVATTPINLNQVNEPTEKPQTKPTVASQAMQAKAAASSPGWLMTAYMVFLSTLNKSFGAGIEQSYKPLLQGFMDRQKVLNTKNAIPEDAKKLVESGKFDRDVMENASLLVQQNNISEGSPEYDKIVLEMKQDMSLPSEQKIAITTNKMLKKIEPLEKQTSFGSMASQTLYLSLFNTATRLAGGLIGFGATMLLQTLMPKESN